MSSAAIVASFMGFLLIGAVQAFYGPLQFALQGFYGVRDSSLIISLHFLGSVTGILTFAPVVRRTGWRWALVSSSALLGLGCLGVAVAPTWVLVLAGAFVIGLGFGGFDIGLNTLFTSSFGTRSAAMSNILNAMFGVGSILGPLVVSFSTDRHAPPFLGIAALCLPMALMFGALSNRGSSEMGSVRLRITGLFALFIALFFVYVGLEVGAANLQPRHLRDVLSYSESSAAQWNGLFWGGLTASRLLIAPIALRFSASSIVIGSVLLVLLGAVLTQFGGVAAYAYVLIGLGCGPVFPTGLVWFTRAMPNGAAVLSIVIAAASLGAVVLPPLLSSFASDATRVPITLIAMAVLLVGIVIATRSATAARASSKI
jgi:MFS transporter, FHS family, glucose/mannose:H+ symporter